MQAPLKTKGFKKVKETKKEVSIEEGIPDIPEVSDFNVEDCFESASKKNFEAVKKSEEEVVLNQFNLNKQNKNEENILESNENNSLSQTETKNISTSDKIENFTEEDDIDKFYFSQTQESERPTQNLTVVKENNLVKTEYLDKIQECENLDSISNYYNLNNTIKTLVVEHHEPSAPVKDQANVSEHSTENNLQVPEAKTVIFEKPVDISKYNFTYAVKDFLPPFTDEKLAEFYYNAKLGESRNYVTEFILQEFNNKAKKDNKLYHLLMDYIKSKNDLKSNEAKIHDLKNKLSICISTIWTVWDNVEVTEKENCVDGNVVTFVEKYTQAQFNSEIFQEYSLLLNELKQVVYEVHIMNSFKCSVIQLKIEHYLQCLLNSCPEFTTIQEVTFALMSESSLNSYFQKCLLDLKLAISVLFFFQRKQTLDVESNFLEETRQWLSDLVSVLVRVGSWKDHIFLLNHIMRCPGGVNEWATQFLQLPIPKLLIDPFNNFEINHIMAVMNILLSPVEQRENFIRKSESELVNDVNPWIFVDSDGEVEDSDQELCPLKENDLVSLLNQIPFRQLFKSLLTFDVAESFIGLVSSNYLLKLFSFCTDLIKILHNGLLLYNTQRHRQFTKRLSRLIFHIVQYVTDLFEIFKSQNISKSEMFRIQVEYDNFLLRASKFIFAAKNHGTWQFLATMPYNMTSPNTILKLYGILQLNEDQKEGFVEINFPVFEEKFLKLSEEEQFYLLTTFSNMALARNISEIQFIKNVVLQLFYIGFLSTATMDYCYKNVKSLLCSICSCHPFLMSEILLIQQNMFLFDPSHDQKLSIYLWMKLPMNIWSPEKKDFETISTWLLEPFHSTKNKLARLILQSLNYGINQGEIFIPKENQRLIAFMILNSNLQLDSAGDTGVIKNVSNLVCSPKPKQMMVDWTWNVLLKLRLHLLDQSEAEICKLLCNLGNYLKSIPDVDSNPELHHLILKKQPIAVYIALMTTTLGHSVPIVVNQGFELVEVLLNSGKYEACVACLEYMTLLFVDCNDSLYKCEKFINLLSLLIASDNSYVQFAKNLISNNFPGPVLKCVESMIQNQLNYCRNINLKKFSEIMAMWLLSLTKLSLWMEEPGILYLIDRLLQNSFFDTVSSKTVTAILGDLLEKTSPTSETKSSFSTLVNWMNTKYSPPSLLPKGFNGEVPWFSYKIISMEFEEFENKSFIWPELLKELYSSSDKKANVDSSLKKVCSLLNLPVISSRVLSIYKWSYQIIETDLAHPLIPLMWQRFFSLYLQRVPGSTDRGSVGVKFFDSVTNQRLFNKLKQRLEETCNYFKTFTEQLEESADNDCFLKCLKIFQTFSLWLNDLKLQEPFLNIHLLPIQYNPGLLNLLLQNDKTPWIEFLEHRKMEQNLKNGSLAWLRLRNRHRQKESREINYRKEKMPLDRMIERLNSYEVPVGPPKINFKKYNFLIVSFDTMMNPDKMIFFIKPYLKTLLQYVEVYISAMNENISLAYDMQELLPRLYLHSESQKVLKGHCNGVNKTVNGKRVHFGCSGPAFVKLTISESKLNNQAKQHLEQCDKAFDENLQKAMSSLPSNLVTSSVLIDISIEKLIEEYNMAFSRKDMQKINDLRGTGVHLFYELVRTWCESITHVPLLEKAFEGYIDALGKSFIENNAEENDRILHLIINDGLFGEKISKYFTPNASASHEFIEYYSKSLNCISERKFAILSKFDLTLWLSEAKPKFSERSRMISAVGQGLRTIGRQSEDIHVLKLLNRHMEILLMYDFPEHYGEILNFLIEASESQSISASCWFSFLNSLAFGHFAFAEGKSKYFQNIFEPGQNLKKLKGYLHKFATDQNLIPFEVIKGTVTLLASHFKEERLKVGHSGLFQKYKMYVEPLFIFYGMLSYSLVAKALEVDVGSLSDKIAQQLWPLICDLYLPWLVPFQKENENSHNAQLFSLEPNYESCILLPWTTSDSCYASFCASMFVESIRFIFDALPGVNHVLSYTWLFYATNFAHIYVKDYILNIIHISLLSLPWEKFVPNLQDIEMMLKVVDQFLPFSHSFLGNIFVSVKWTELVEYYLIFSDLITTSKLHICLLHLLVKLPLEPSLKQNEKVTSLLTEANGYAWHLVDSSNYDIVLNWFIMSCDPRIILMDERLDYYKLDSAILRLLKSCAGYFPSAKSFHPTTLTKRLMFVRACIKLLITSNRRFKSRDSPLFRSALQTIWSNMETVINETVPPEQKIDEAKMLLSESFLIFAEPDLSSVAEATLIDWLSTLKSHTIVYGLFRSTGVSIENPRLFGSIMELNLENYFNFIDNCDWAEINKCLVPFSKSNSDTYLKKVLIDNNYFLTLYAVLLKKFNKNENEFQSEVVLTDLLQLLLEVKLNAELEPKLILVISFGLGLAERKMKLNLKDGISYLIKFCNALNYFVVDKGNGFFSAIGLKKSASSNKFKLICLIASSGISIFVKNNFPEYEKNMNEKILLTLESVDSNKVYQNIHEYASYAKNAVKEMTSLNQIVDFLKQMGLKLFNKLYLK